MNYVGCKGSKHNTNLASRLVLFYMNYVGCKVIIWIAYVENSLSFIWTMWDVKTFTSSILATIILQFYMNYVGCKVSFIHLVLGQIERFYMNYVGCKETCSKHLAKGRLGFIWTMWDVKKYKKIYLRTFDRVLYELCGM